MTRPISHRTFSVIAAALLWLLCVCAPAFALDPIGKITTLRGVVSGSLTDGKSKSALKKDDAVFQNQIITTGPDGFVEIVFVDESVLSIGRNAEVTLDTFVYDPAKGKGETVFELTRGVFRFLSGAIGKAVPQNVKYKTPTSTIGIRGSGAVVDVASSGATRVVLTHCCVDVASGGGKRALQEPLTYTIVLDKNSAPTAPQQLTLADKTALLEEFGLTAAPATEQSKEPAQQTEEAPTAKPGAQKSTTPTGNTPVEQLQHILGLRQPDTGTGQGSAKDGQRGGLASGSIGIKVRIVENIQADLVRADGRSFNMDSDNFSGDETFCVYHNGAGYYNITATGTGPGGAFIFTNPSGVQVPYTVSWESTQEKVLLEPSKPSFKLSRGSDFGAACNEENKNARLRISIPPQYRGLFKQGNFSGQTVILIETE
ncbi:MAG: hypothetical protein GC134_04880 [Proteobacteria bacterium]|nr:hypothetical protein [Pseudomonadota bacterium]